MTKLAKPGRTSAPLVPRVSIIPYGEGFMCVMRVGDEDAVMSVALGGGPTVASARENAERFAAAMGDLVTKLSRLPEPATETIPATPVVAPVRELAYDSDDSSQAPPRKKR